jgi:hypothetical protein
MEKQANVNIIQHKPRSTGIHLMYTLPLNNTFKKGNNHTIIGMHIHHALTLSQYVPYHNITCTGVCVVPIYSMMRVWQLPPVNPLTVCITLQIMLNSYPVICLLYIITDNIQERWFSVLCMVKIILEKT